MLAQMLLTLSGLALARASNRSPGMQQHEHNSLQALSGHFANKHGSPSSKAAWHVFWAPGTPVVKPQGATLAATHIPASLGEVHTNSHSSINEVKFQSPVPVLNHACPCIGPSAKRCSRACVICVFKAHNALLLSRLLVPTTHVREGCRYHTVMCTDAPMHDCTRASASIARFQDA